MNKEELEQAFNETTDNAVKVINDYKKLIVKYNIMEENAETLAKRIDRAIEYIKKTRYKECYETKGNFDYELLEILKGDNND